ncbi:MAG: ABC transporter substrate-binding protein [Bacillota bacterium]
MSSIVLELQQDLLKKDCDMPAALRKAHIIAYKLKLKDFDKWITSELNGYIDQKAIPEYRKVVGDIKWFNCYHGWAPVVFHKSEELERELKEHNIDLSIIGIEKLCKESAGNQVSFKFIPKVQDMLRQATGGSDEEFSLLVGKHVLQSLMEMVKNQLLDWTLKLEEEGILGEDLMFSLDEKEKARELPPITNIFNGPTTMISSNDGSINVATGDGSKTVMNYGYIKNIIEEIRSTMDKEDISQENKKIAEELISELEEKVEFKKSTVIIKSTLSALRDFLISIGASLTAAMIQAKII